MKKFSIQKLRVKNNNKTLTMAKSRHFTESIGATTTTVIAAPTRIATTIPPHEQEKLKKKPKKPAKYDEMTFDSTMTRANDDKKTKTLFAAPAAKSTMVVENSPATMRHSTA